MTMEDEIFADLFEKRINSIKLSIDDKDNETGSRIGGYAPAYFNNSTIDEYGLTDYLYYLTIDSELLPINGNQEVSVFYPKDFNLYNRNNKYPLFPVKCIFHPSSKRGDSEIVFNKYIKQKSIISLGLQADMEGIESIDDDMDDTEYEPVYGSKIGGNPTFLQDEFGYTKDLKNDNYYFVMQIDESWYLRDQVTGNEPFNHGIIYFYGIFIENVLDELVGWFWQN